MNIKKPIFIVSKKGKLTLAIAQAHADLDHAIRQSKFATSKSTQSFFKYTGVGECAKQVVKLEATYLKLFGTEYKK